MSVYLYSPVSTYLFILMPHWEWFWQESFYLFMSIHIFSHTLQSSHSFKDSGTLVSHLTKGLHLIPTVFSWFIQIIIFITHSSILSRWSDYLRVLHMIMFNTPQLLDFQTFYTHFHYSHPPFFWCLRHLSNKLSLALIVDLWLLFHVQVSLLCVSGGIIMLCKACFISSTSFHHIP